MGVRIFISHLADEAEIALALSECLSDEFGERVAPFVSSDLRSIQAGERWLEAMDGALQEAAVMVVLCSHRSVAQPWIQFESGAAWMKKIPLVPVCHSGLRPSSLPVPFSLLQGVDLRMPESLASLFHTVGNSVGKAPSESGVRSAFEKLEAADNRLQRFNSQKLLGQAKRNLRSWLCTLLIPLATAFTYWLSLSVSDGDSEAPGAILLIAGIVWSLVGSALAHLYRGEVLLSSLIPTALLVALVSGALSALLYFSFVNDADPDFWRKEAFEIAGFLLAVVVGFCGGAVISTELRRAPDDSLAKRFVDWLVA